MSQTSSSEPGPSAERRGELEKNLAEVRNRIAAACAAAGRDPGEITLIAITKTRPPADVLLLHELGLTDFGENKDQEAAPKAAACAAALAADADAGRTAPAPDEASRSAGTSSASCRPTRRPAWPGTPTSCTPWTGYASSAPSARPPGRPAGS